MNENFQTREFYLTALLHALGVKLVSVNKQGSVYVFEFQDIKKCNQIRSDLLRGEITVNASSYINSIRVIKDLIFSS